MWRLDMGLDRKVDWSRTWSMRVCRDFVMNGRVEQIVVNINVPGYLLNRYREFTQKNPPRRSKRSTRLVLR